MEHINEKRTKILRSTTAKMYVFFLFSFNEMKIGLDSRLFASQFQMQTIHFQWLIC